MLSTTARNFGFSENDALDREAGSSGVASRNSSVSGFGLAWDARRGRWISLVYRYVFPKSSFISESGSQLGSTKGRFEFGPCKQHHLTIGQSPFVRRQRHMAAASRTIRRRRRYTQPESKPRLSHISEENLMSFLTDPEPSENEDGETLMSYLAEDDETTLLNDFLSSAIVDHGPGGHNGWSAAMDGQQLVAPSSPPPPLFLDDVQDSVFLY